MPVPPIRVVVAGHATPPAAPPPALAAQTWRAWTLAPVPTAALDAPLCWCDGTALLAPVVLEQAWWALETDPSLAYVLVKDAAGQAQPDAFVLLRGGLAPALAAVLAEGGPADAGRRLVTALAGASLAGLVLTMPHLPAPAAPDGAPFNVPGLRRDGGVHLQHPIQSLTTAPSPEAAGPPRAPGGGRRVLVLLQGFPMGGYTAFNADLLPALAAGGASLTVATTEYYYSDWRLAEVRAAVPDVHHLLGIVPPAAVLRYLTWLIESRGIEAVFLSHSFLGFRLLPWLRRRFPRVAVVDFTHTDWNEVHMYGSYAQMARQYAPLLDHALVTSEALARDFTAAGVPAARVSACHLGIDAAWWQRGPHANADVARQLRGGHDRPVVLFAARVSPEKRPLLAWEVVEGLWRAGHDFSFVVAGHGPLLGELLARVEASPWRDRVVCLGEADHMVLRAVYAAADVYFVPSEIEGVARTLYEAMAMGCVPVVADVGGQRELAVPDCGVAVPHGPEERAAYAQAIATLLTDVPRRAAMAAAARGRIEAHFTFAAAVTRVTRTLDAAVARRHALPPAAAADAAGALPALDVAALALEATRRLVIAHSLAAAARR